MLSRLNNEYGGILSECTRFYGIALAVILAGAVGVYLLDAQPDSLGVPEDGTASSGAPLEPLPSDLTGAQSARGFQVLVSYTERGFEPRRASVKQGDTVRFTNNSRRALWVAADASGGVLYPSVVNSCGSSALDSCAAMEPGRYWEFTFEHAGSWGFKNNLFEKDTGVIEVR